MKNYAFDPELAPYLPLMPAVIDFSTGLAIRAFWSRFTAQRRPIDKTDDIEIDDHHIAGLAGDASVRVRLYQKKERSRILRPAILEFHGGGFIIGDVQMQDAWCARLAKQLGALVVSVDYRLAPEHPFPAAPDDGYAALCWLHREAGNLGVDSARIALAGQSAGACLAVSTALRARDLKGPTVCFQLLETPVLDDRLTTPSMREFVDTPMWNRPNAQWSWKHYLGEGTRDAVSPYAAPARATDLRGLPPTYLSTMEFDPLRDEGIEFALRLMQAGISVELHNYPGTFHGSTVIGSASVTQRNFTEITEAFRRHFS
jgi:acetyl esterase